MNASTTAPGVPMYLEIAAAPAVAGSDGALLQDYLAILACYFDKPDADRSPVAVSQAIANLPGLLLSSNVQSSDQSSLPQRTSRSTREALANLLAAIWGVGADSLRLLPLARPMSSTLETGEKPASEGNSIQVTLIVLQRPAAAPPTIGYTSLTLTLQQDAPRTPTAPVPPAVLSTKWTRTTYTVVDAELSSSQQFVAQLRQQGLLADLNNTAGYLEISTA